MRLRNLVALALFGAALLLVSAPAAFATSYGGDGGIDLSNPSPNKGDSITVKCGGWMPDSDVTIVLHSDPVTLATVAADGSGNIDATVSIPSSVDAGAHTLELTGTDPSGTPRTVTAALEVGSGGGSSLPRTGAAIAALVGVATVLFVTGTALSQARKRAID
jgi:hypothetical protein